VRGVSAGFKAQLWNLRHSFDELQTFVIAPLLTLIFGGVMVAAGRRDLLPAAALGAALMGVWMLCTQTGGNIIERERWEGTFEVLMSTPTALRGIVFGRVTAIVGVMVLVFPEVWLVVLAIFGEPIAVPHPGLFVLSLVGTLIGAHATTLLFAALFVLARDALIFQNALAYPIYLLGGVLVPVAVLPGWVHPISRMIFLSWGSDLLRAALRPSAVPDVSGKLIGLATTVVVMVVASQILIGIMVRRAKVRGSLSLV